jgi:hypothetical protein
MRRAHPNQRRGRLYHRDGNGRRGVVVFGLGTVVATAAWAVVALVVVVERLVKRERLSKKRASAVRATRGRICCVAVGFGRRCVISHHHEFLRVRIVLTYGNRRRRRVVVIAFERRTVVATAAWAVLALGVIVEPYVGRESLSKQPASADLAKRGLCVLVTPLIEPLKPSQPIPDETEATARQHTADQRRQPVQACIQGRSQIPRRLDP